MYVVQLPLLPTKAQSDIFEKRFGIIAHIHNQVVSFAKKQLRKLKRDKQYYEILGLILTSNKKIRNKAAAYTEEQLNHLPPKERKKYEREVAALEKEHRRFSNEMDQLISSYKLDRSGVCDYVKKQQKMFANHISSQQAQSEAENVLDGINSVLYGKGKDVHYKKRDDFRTISGKEPTNGVRFYCKEHPSYWKKKEPIPYKACIDWNGLIVPVHIDRSNTYLCKAIKQGKIRYCEILRLPFHDGFHYYVVLVMEGDAPIKERVNKKTGEVTPITHGDGRMGLDPGTSTVAGVTDKALILRELASGAAEYEREIKKLQASIDRSKRISNPENYKEDGTIKKGKYTWNLSKNCRKKIQKVRVLYAKRTAFIKNAHHRLANEMIQQCESIITEDMDYAALQRRSKKPAERQEKETTITKKNGEQTTVKKFKRKKRFGHSMDNHSPGAFMVILAMTCAKYGVELIKLNPKTLRASQYNHVTGECEPAPLSMREKEIGGKKVQRDAYSGFILENVSDDLQSVNREKCKEKFENFVSTMNAEIKRMKESGISMKSCFGF